LRGAWLRGVSGCDADPLSCRLHPQRPEDLQFVISVTVTAAVIAGSVVPRRRGSIASLDQIDEAADLIHLAMTTLKADPVLNP
jgi:hypothetical protein